MKRIILLAAITASFLGAGQAQAKTGVLKLRTPAVQAAGGTRASAARLIWYVTPYLMAESLYYYWDDGDITYAACQGLWAHRHVYRYGHWYFHRFICSAETYQSEWYSLAITIINRSEYRWRVLNHYYEAGRR